MREIKFLGTYRKKGVSRGYQYSIFECPSCRTRVEKIRRDGLKSKGCSHKCARAGIRRGAYKEKVEINGYLYIYRPEHPNCTKSGYVAEHRLVIEEHLDRSLDHQEVIHHINEDKKDNRVENLMVMTASEHSRLHAIERWGS